MRILKLELKDGVKVDGWIKAKNLSDSNIKDFIKANLRELFDDEIVLDIETKFHSKQVKKQLDKEGWAYEQWSTQSRGHHFHITVEKLDNLDEERRLLYREEVIKKFHADTAKKNGFIAMEHKPHLKSGKHKILISKKKGINKLDTDILQNINQKTTTKKQVNLNNSNNNININRLKRKYLVSELWQRWGLSKKGNRWDTPFATSKSKACVAINDEKGLWYDFNTAKGGDVITAIQMKYDCSFIEATTILEEGKL